MTRSTHRAGSEPVGDQPPPGPVAVRGGRAPVAGVRRVAAAVVAVRGGRPAVAGPVWVGVRRLAAVAAASVVVAALLGACGAPAPPDRRVASTVPPSAVPGVPPFADCAALTAPPPKAPATVPGGAAPQDLPAATLDCFTGGASVPVANLRGPAVVNLWATWCPPCRQELPVFQQLAEQAGDRVHVIGVDTMDDRAEAIRLAERLGVTFPTLVDPTREVLRSYGGLGLPMTLFVDGEGKVRHVYNNKALDGETLSALVQQHLGLAVNLG